MFKQQSHDHLSGSGCPKCRTSKGELQVIDWLNNKNISYIYQKKFNNCLSPKGWALIFDFYLYDKNIIIEVDGEQHYHPCKMRNYNISQSQVNWIQLKDEIKNNYCKSNGITILRIPYWIKNIPQLLEENI